MAANAGWICSAGSSGSASSLRSIQCVRALSRYIRRRQTCWAGRLLLSNRSSTAWLASITIITVQLLTNAGLLQVHMFTVNVVAPYTDIYTKKWCQISSASLPERHVRVPKQSYIDFGDNFNFGELVCRHVWLSASWSVGELVVGELDCRWVGLSAGWSVVELSSYRKWGGCALPSQLGIWRASWVPSGDQGRPRAFSSCQKPDIRYLMLAIILMIFFSIILIIFKCSFTAESVK